MAARGAGRWAGPPNGLQQLLRLWCLSATLAYDWCDSPPAGQPAALPACHVAIPLVTVANRSTVEFDAGMAEPGVFDAGSNGTIDVNARDQYGDRMAVGAGFVLCARFRWIGRGGFTFTDTTAAFADWGVVKHSASGSFTTTCKSILTL